MDKNIYTQVIVWISLAVIIIILVLCIIYWTNENYLYEPKDFFPQNEASFTKKRNIADCPDCRYGYHDPIWRKASS